MERNSKLISLYDSIIIFTWALFIIFFIVSGISNISRNVKVNNLEESINYTEYIMSNNTVKDRKRLDNPNDFNENCVINETNYYNEYNESDLVPVAMKFYDITGCQLYFVCVDLTGVDNVEYFSILDAENYAKSHVKELISDDYGVILYESPYLSIGRYNSISIDKMLLYGSKVSDVFDSWAREVSNDIVQNANGYKNFYKEGVSQVSYIPLEIARQLFPDSFQVREEDFSSKFSGGRTIVDINQALKEIDLCKSKSMTFRLIWVVSLIISILSTIFLFKKRNSLLEINELLKKEITTTDEILDKYKS